MIFVKISHNFIKSPLKICLTSQIPVHSLWHVCRHQNLVPWSCLPLTCGYIHVLNHEKKCIKSDFKEIFWNLQQMTEVTRDFCWHQNFVPWSCLSLTCGCIHLLNHEKMCIVYKVRSWRDSFFFNLQQMTIVMRPSCWHQNGLSAPTLGLCLNFFSSVTADFNISSASTQVSDTGPLVLWF